MLVQNNKEEILILKLVNGDEIITKVVAFEDGKYIVEKPFILIMSQQGPQFSPMLIMADPEAPVEIGKVTVVAKTKPSANMLSGYEKATSKIVIPTKSGIIV